MIATIKGTIRLEPHREPIEVDLVVQVDDVFTEASMRLDRLLEGLGKLSSEIGGAGDKLADALRSRGK